MSEEWNVLLIDEYEQPHVTFTIADSIRQILDVLPGLFPGIDVGYARVLQISDSKPREEREPQHVAAPIRWVNKHRAYCPEHPVWVPPMRDTPDEALADAEKHNRERHSGGEAA